MDLVTFQTFRVIATTPMETQTFDQNYWDENEQSETYLKREMGLLNG